MNYKDADISYEVDNNLISKNGNQIKSDDDFRNLNSNQSNPNTIVSLNKSSQLHSSDSIDAQSGSVFSNNFKKDVNNFNNQDNSNSHKNLTSENSS